MKRPWFPLYVADFVADTLHLTAEQTGAYVLLLMHYWQHRGLPSDDRILSRISRVHPPHWPRTREVLRQFFVPQEGGSWVSKRMELELNKTDEISNKRKAAAEQMLSKRAANVVHLRTHARASSHPQSQLQRKEDRKKEVSPSEKLVHLWPDDFAERFWQQYPRKAGKKVAIKALTGVRDRDEVSFEVLMAAVARYGAAGLDQQYICHPTTWINQGRWADEPASSNNGHIGKQPNGRINGSEQATRLADELRARERAAGIGGAPSAVGGDRPRIGDVEFLPPERR